MCSAIEGLIEDGRNEGLKEGRKEGRKEGELTFAYKMLKKGRMTLDEIAKDIGMSIDELLVSFKQYNLSL